MIHHIDETFAALVAVIVSHGLAMAACWLLMRV